MTRRALKLRIVTYASVLAAALAAGCGPRRPWADLQPAPATMMRQVADCVLVDFPQPPPFNWGEGVLMAGMIRAGTVLDEPAYIDFVKRWADRWRASDFERLLRDGPSEGIKGYCGYWGPGYPVMLLHERTGDAACLEMARQIAVFIMKDATRTSDGGLGHWRDNRQLWVDTLYMVCPPFAHLTKVTGDPSYLEEAVRQIGIYQGHCQDENGLFWHMYDDPSGRRVGTLWGRGNGWVAMSYAIVLENLPRKSPAYRKLLGEFCRLADALLAVQDRDTYMWHTVLDHPETYLETSATAMILSSLVQADHLGLYETKDKSVIPRTWSALARKVDAQGRVFDVSGGTMPHELETYATKEKGTYTWGTGAFLLAAAGLASE